MLEDELAAIRRGCKGAMRREDEEDDDDDVKTPAPAPAPAPAPLLG